MPTMSVTIKEGLSDGIGVRLMEILPVAIFQRRTEEGGTKIEFAGDSREAMIKALQNAGLTVVD